MTATACRLFGGRRLTQTALFVSTLLAAGLLSVVRPSAAHAAPVLFQPQPGRTAEWNGQSDGFDAASVDAAGQNFSYLVVDDADHDGNITQQLPDVNSVAAAGVARGTNTKVLAHYSATRFALTGYLDLAPYADTFPTDNSWKLLDADGNPIPYFAADDPDHTAPLGYLVNTSVLGYRTWLATTVALWLARASFAGIMLDASAVVDGDDQPAATIGDGATWNELLCGPGTYTGNCDRVTAMNNGLRQAVAAVATAVHLLGLTVAYSSVAADNPRGPARNLGLLDYADVAANDSFCLADAARPVNPVTDWAIMDQQAARGKQLIQVVTYGSDSVNQRYGSYCTAAFLLGWQPGLSYLVYHKDANHPMTSAPPTPDLNINLGTPTGPRVNENSLYSRTFTNGYVALNPTRTTKLYRTPAAATLYRNGQPVASYPANAVLCVPAQSSVLLFANRYLYGT